MKSIGYVLVLSCIFSAAPASAAGLEALKAGVSLPSIGSILRNQAPVPDIPASAAVQGHDAAGYATEAAARSALNAVRDRLTQAGITVLGARTTRDGGGKYGFHLDYLDSLERPGTPGRAIETYTSPEFAQAREASTEMNRSVAGLSAAGFVILRSQAAGQAGRFTYTIDYIRGAPQAPRPNFYYFTSPIYHYGLRAVALRDMQVTMLSLQAQGYRILSYYIYPVPGTVYVRYDIRYFGR